MKEKEMQERLRELIMSSEPFKFVNPSYLSAPMNVVINEFKSQILQLFRDEVKKIQIEKTLEKVAKMNLSKETTDKLLSYNIYTHQKLAIVDDILKRLEGKDYCKCKPHTEGHWGGTMLKPFKDIIICNKCNKEVKLKKMEGER